MVPGCEDENRRAVLEPTDLLALPESRITGDPVRTAVREIERLGQAVEPHARDQDRGDGHEHEGPWISRVPILQGLHQDDGALVLAKELLDPRERDRVHVPSVAGDVRDLANAGVHRSVEPVIHRRAEPERRERSVAQPLTKRRVRDEILEIIREALRLVDAGALDRAARSDDRVARARDDLWAQIDRPRAVAELADETVAK